MHTANISLPSSVAVVIQIWSLQTTGEDQPRPWTAVFHVTLLDSLQSVVPKGIVCMAGHLDGRWTMAEFTPMSAVPYSVRFTTINTHGLTRENSAAPLQNILYAVEAGRYRVNLDRTFQLDEIVEAHRYMEENRAAGKPVVFVD